VQARRPPEHAVNASINRVLRCCSLARARGRTSPSESPSTSWDSRLSKNARLRTVTTVSGAASASRSAGGNIKAAGSHSLPSSSISTFFCVPFTGYAIFNCAHTAAVSTCVPVHVQ